MPFILIAIGLILIVLNYKAIKIESHSFEIQDRDNSFSKVLDNSKNEMSDYKLELGLLRRNLGESLTDIQEEILEIKTRLHRIENGNCIKEDVIKVEDNINDDVISEISILKNDDIETSVKTEKIKEFLQMGLTEEEICHTLSVSKGEVLLVKELFKK
ncbi:MAG: hypothetical protein E7207_04090 [Clostridium butyricum]|nr:hypothetical protein [Clostridium butyricum]